MIPERWDEIKGKLHAALELEPEQRAMYLNEVAAADPELRNELESLIASHNQAGEDFLDSPVSQSHLLWGAEKSAEKNSSPLRGNRIGPYEIVEEIGLGGMGTVYRAFRADDHYHKEVAIKLVNTGRDSGFVLNRFRNERQILASLDHPNIARLLDGGSTEEGTPYFVMEFIDGQPVNAYCDRHQLTIQARLQLFLQVCSAVQYAHQHLIVHRDIKPGNILVNAEGIPKLLDFGIAKILDVEAVTGKFAPTLTVFRAMTPAYASPEQIEEKPITTASDVYSLGVVLYELLTGCHPFRREESSPQQIAAAVCESAPEKPSTVLRRMESKTPNLQIDARRRRAFADSSQRSKKLRGDLDNIIFMAMRKEPQRRYASVEQFAEDIRRHLENRAVIARKDTAGYRASKFIRRHKAGVSATAAVVVILIATLIVTIREARIAAQQASLAREQHARAEKRFRDVRELANSLIFEIHDSIQNLPGATQPRKLLVDRALKYLDSLSQEASDDPGLQRELASAYERLGDVQGMPNAASVGDSAGAQGSYLKSIELLESVLRSSAANNRDRLQLSAVHDKLAILLSALGDLNGVADHAARAASLARAVADSDSPQAEEALSKFARAEVGLGDIYWDMNTGFAARGDPRAALPYYETAAETNAKLLQKNSQDRTALRRKGVIEERFARVQMLMGLRKDAMAHLQTAAAIFDALAVRYKDYDALRGVGTNNSMIGDVLVLNGRFAESIPYYRRELEIDERHAVLDPNNFDSSCGGPYANVGYSLARSGNLAEGLNLIRRAIARDERCVAHDPAFAPARSNLASDHVREADVLHRAGKNAEALKSYQRAREIYAALAHGNPQNVEAQLNLSATQAKVAALQVQLGQIEPARVTFREVIESSEKLRNLSSEEVRYTLVEAYSGQGDAESYVAIHAASRAKRIALFSEARSFYEKSLTAWNELMNPGVVSPKGFAVRDAAEIKTRLVYCEAALGSFRASSVRKDLARVE
jgi:eukaryotic-like serine/threonine-protein kinase